MNTSCRLASMSLLLSVAATAMAAEPTMIGRAKVVIGKSFVVRAEKRLPLKVGDALFEHDMLETMDDGSIGITFVDNTAFSVGATSRIAIDTYFFDPKSLKGSLVAHFQKGTM